MIAGLNSTARELRASTVTSSKIVDVMLEKAGKVEPLIRSHAIINPAIRGLAKRADERRRRRKYGSPLEGVPISIKDLIDTRGLVTAYGSRIFAGHVPKRDAKVVENLVGSGALVFGKTHTQEFGFGIETPPTRNPWDTGRIPGGSSGGSAAAVASGLALLALGTDTGGSIRIPAAMCGVLGLKPTYGAISNDGCFTDSFSFDHVGPLCRFAEDLIPVLAGMGYALRAPPRRRLRIGLMSNLFDECKKRARAVVTKAVDKMVSERIIEVNEFKTTMFPTVRRYREIVTRADAATVHQDLYLKHRDKLGKISVKMLELGLSVKATEYIQAFREKEKLTIDFERETRRFDALIAPTLPDIAPQKSEMERYELKDIRAIVDFVAPFNYFGTPAMSIPCGFAQGMPVGLQAVAARWKDGVLVRLASEYQKTTDWHTRVPQAMA